jgi:hypothetical protein
VIKLADGKARQVQPISVTTFWTDPTTRKGLLDELAKRGFGRQHAIPGVIVVIRFA